MKKALQNNLFRLTGIAGGGAKILAGLLLAVGMVTTVRGQGELASGTVSSSGSGPYTYDLTFSDAASATSPIGSVWYAWIPGFFYLPGTPTSASAPAGWAATVVGNSVQFSAMSAADDIPAGGSLSGFSYEAAFSPAELAAAPDSGVSVAYSGGFFSDAGNTFTVQTAVVPEPSTLALLVCGATWVWAAGRRRLRTA
jgi:hypothetical protein